MGSIVRPGIISAWLLLSGLACSGSETSQVVAPPETAVSDLKPKTDPRFDVWNWPQRTERPRQYDVGHYRIRLRFDEEKKAFWGETTITLSPLTENLTTCVLDAETYTVDTVSDGEGRALDFEQLPHQLVVQLSRPYQQGEQVQVNIAYHAQNVQVDSEAFGMAADYDLGLDFKEETSEHPSLINTLSFPEGARHWFPCYDHPNDRATSEIIATVRSDYRVLSNGRLVNVTENQSQRTKTFHWSQEQAHPTYLFVLVAGPYVVLEDSLGSLPIHYWVYEKDRADALRSFAKTPEIIAFFNRQYGVDYPWAKYDQVTIPGIGGGAESTTATVLSQATIHDARADQDFSSQPLVAHEVAHHWWGNLVSYRDWSHTWVSEGFATYSEYLYTKHELGEEAGAINLLAKKNRYLEEANNKYVRPIVFDRWRYPNDNFDNHSYAKAATVLNMLRWVTGEQPFAEAINSFLEDHAFQPVSTDDLLSTFERITGQELNWFFQQWFLSPGHPVFEVSYRWEPTTGSVRIRVAQLQDTSAGTPVFRSPVVFSIVTGEGKTSHKVWLEHPVEEFELEAAAEPLMVRFDEGNYLLKEWTFQKPLEELLYQAGHDDVIGRAWALSQLEEHATSPPVVLKWIEAAEQDPSWYVRGTATEKLGALGLATHVGFLQRKSMDDSARVRAIALTALGDYQHEGLAPFFAQRFEVDDSYLVQAEALRAIGKCGNASWQDYLEKASDLKSPQDVIRSAAEWALQQIRKRSQGVYRM